MKNRTLSFLHLGVVAFVILIHIQYWTAYARELHGEPSLDTLAIFIYLIPLFILISISESLHPEIYSSKTTIDMNKYYWENCKRFYTWIIYYIVCIIIFDIFSVFSISGFFATMMRLALIGFLVLAIKFNDRENKKHKLFHYISLFSISAMLILFIECYTPSVSLD